MRSIKIFRLFSLRCLSDNSLLNQDQQALQELALQFARQDLAPFASEWDRKRIFPVETIKKAADLGFSAIYTPEKYGGIGLGRFEGAIIFEALSKGCVPTAAYLAVHNMNVNIIATYGNDWQRQNLLPQCISLDWFTSYCLTEPSSGSDAISMRSNAVEKEDHFLLNGQKMFITGMGKSDLYVTMCKTGEKQISCLLVEKNFPGVSFGKSEEKMGWNSHPTGLVHFEDVKVPKSHLLGRLGDGFKIAMNGLDGGRINIASCSLGGAWEAIERTQQYMTERKQFNKPLHEFQHLSFKFADCITDFQASRLMVYESAKKFDSQHQDTTISVAMAKKFATEACFNIVNNCLQFYGGYGYLKEYQIERIFRDLRVHMILEGTNEIMRLIISRSIFQK